MYICINKHTLDFSKRIRNGVANPQDLTEGIYNYLNNINTDLAKTRAETCVGCAFFKDEPISFLKVEDEELPVLTGKFCSLCGCVTSYKLRLDKIKKQNGLCSLKS